MLYILNADDFGRTATANQAITECFQKGTVTNTSIMVTMPFYEEAKRLAKDNGFWDKVGLHINLTSGIPLTEEIKQCRAFTNENGFFNSAIFKKKRITLVLTLKEKKAVKKEIEAQIQRYILDGFTLMHADSHGHIHAFPSLKKIVFACLKRYGFKSVRISRNIHEKNGLKKLYKKISNKQFQKLGYSTDYFGSIADALRMEENEKQGVCEIMTHPNYFDGVFGYGEPIEESVIIKNFPNKISFLDCHRGER